VISRPGAGRVLRVHVDAVEVQFAALVGAVEGEQAGLEGDEGDRVAGREAGPEAAAGVGVEAAGDVEGQARAGLGVEGVDPAA
jgi:hypothetical protein